MEDKTYKRIMLLLGTATALSTAGGLLWKLKDSKPKTVTIKSAGNTRDFVNALHNTLQSHCEDINKSRPE